VREIDVMVYQNVLNLIGRKEPTSIFEVEREAIRRYADAIDDANPLYYDEKYADKSKLGTIIAPPGFISSPWFLNRPEKWPGRSSKKDTIAFADLCNIMKDAGFDRLLDAGQNFEFYKNVKAGDTIKIETQVKNIKVKYKRSGDKTAMLTLESIYTNQNQERVAVLEWNIVF
jgi:acyl dehydratase